MKILNVIFSKQINDYMRNVLICLHNKGDEDSMRLFNEFYEDLIK